METVKAFVVITLLTLLFCVVKAPRKLVKGKAVPPAPKKKGALNTDKGISAATYKRKFAKFIRLQTNVRYYLEWDKDIVQSFLNGIEDPPSRSGLSKIIKETIESQMSKSKSNKDKKWFDCIEALNLLDAPWDNSFIFLKIKKNRDDEQKVKNFKLAVTNVIKEHVNRFSWLSKIMEDNKIPPQTLINDLKDLLKTVRMIQYEDAIISLLKRTKISFDSLIPELDTPSEEEAERILFVTGLKSALAKLIGNPDQVVPLKRFAKLKKPLDNLIITQAFLVQTIDLKEKLEIGKIKYQDFKAEFNDYFYNLVNRQIKGIKYDIENILPN